MKRIITFSLAVLVAAFTVAPVWADNIHIGGSETTTINNNPSANASAAAAATAVSNPVQNSTQVNTQVTSQGQHQGQGQEQGQYQGQGQGQGQKQSANNEGVKVETDVPRMAPPAIAPSLAVSSLTCYGSWGVGLSTPFGGVSGGGPVKDQDCERSRNALIFVNIGLRDVALALLAGNPDNAAAMKAAGITVPGQKAELPAPAVVAAPVVVAPAVAVSKSENPTCGDGKPAALTASGFYSCATYRVVPK